MNAIVDRLRLVDIGKSFGAVRALDGVDMAVKRGTVHGLLGENGAGKSTLLRILSGVYQPSSGHVEIDGVRLSGHGPVAARIAGIAMIHQELQHVPELTVAQNMFLGRPLKTAGGLLVARRRQEQAAAQALAPLDPNIDPAAPIRTLKVAQRQIIEIARAMMEDAKILAMDEPTSSLTPAEFERLAVLIADLAAQGVSIIYVSHKMDEVFRVCETATILRDGRKIADVVLKDTTESAVVARMVGRELASAEHKGFAKDEIVLDVSGLSRGTAVRDASLKLRKGEVLGISGLVGSGRTELLRLIAGIDRPDAGEVKVEGRKLGLGSPRAAIAAGLGLLPEERKRDGIVARRSVRSNIGLSSMHRFSRLGFVRRRALAAESERLMRDLNLGHWPSSGRSASSRAATSRRPSSAAGSPPARASFCSTNRRAASTSAPRPKSTR